MIKDGTQNGITDRESSSFLPGKLRCPQKKAAGSPIINAINEEQAACNNVNPVIRAI